MTRTVILVCACAAMLVVIPYKILLSQESPDVLSVDVELVNVSATVIDESGRYVEDLTAKDFQVFENGREQKVAFFSHDSTVPISVGVLIDISGSLQDKLRQGLQTVRAIAATLSPADEMFVMTFNTRINIKQRFTSDPDEIQRSLVDVKTKGETAVYDAITAGLREMQTAKHQKRILLLVTDGFDTGSKTNAAQAEELLKRSDVLLYALGIDDDDLHPPHGRSKYHIYDYMLGKLTNAGAGRLIRLYTGRNYDLPKLSELILGELHQEYTISYYPAAGGDSTNWRNIEVRVAKPGVHVVGEKDRRYKRKLTPQVQTDNLHPDRTP